LRFSEDLGFSPVSQPAQEFERLEHPFPAARFCYALFAPCAVAILFVLFGKAAQTRLGALGSFVPLQIGALALVSVACACYCGLLLGRGKNRAGIFLSMLLSLFLIAVNLLATLAAGCSLG